MSWIVASIFAGWFIAAAYLGFNGRPRLGWMLFLSWIVVMGLLFIVALVVGFLDSLISFA